MVYFEKLWQSPGISFQPECLGEFQSEGVGISCSLSEESGVDNQDLVVEAEFFYFLLFLETVLVLYLQYGRLVSCRRVSRFVSENSILSEILSH